MRNALLLFAVGGDVARGSEPDDPYYVFSLRLLSLLHEAPCLFRTPRM